MNVFFKSEKPPVELVAALHKVFRQEGCDRFLLDRTTQDERLEMVARGLRWHLIMKESHEMQPDSTIKVYYKLTQKGEKAVNGYK